MGKSFGRTSGHGGYLGCWFGTLETREVRSATEPVQEPGFRASHCRKKAKSAKTNENEMRQGWRRNRLKVNRKPKRHYNGIKRRKALSGSRREEGAPGRCRRTGVILLIPERSSGNPIHPIHSIQRPPTNDTAPAGGRTDCVVDISVQGEQRRARGTDRG